MIELEQVLSQIPDEAKPVRIAVIFEFGSLHGGEHSMLSVIDQNVEKDVEFAALAPSRGPLQNALKSRGIAHVPFDVRDAHGQRRPQGDVLAELREKLQASECDLAHANSLSMGRLTGAISQELPFPCIAHLRDILKISRAAMRDLNHNTRMVAVSEATRDFHIAQGLDPNRVQTIYNGVDCLRFQPRPDDGSLREELGLSPEDFLVLTVGQIGLRKGQDVLAEAAALLAARWPDLRYLLAGERFSEKQESRDFERRMIERFENLDGGNRLYRLGYRSDMPRLMNAADLLVHPAHQEPLGRVLLEAAASGLPIVATDVGGTREILSHGKSALLVPPNDPQALAGAILQLACDPALRNRLAEQAREVILQKFPISRAADRLLSFWRSVLTNPSSRL